MPPWRGSLGFRISTPDGVEWRWDPQPHGYGPTGPGTGGHYLTVFSQSRMDPVTSVWDFSGLLVSEPNMDGNSPDTVFTALRTGSGEAGTICIDSCFVPPAGSWLFVDAATTSTIVPDIAGPYCWPVTSNPGLRPMVVVAFSPVNIIITDPDGLQFGKDAFGDPIDEMTGATYYEDPHDSIVIDEPKIGDYEISFVTEDGTPEGATFSSIIKIDGLQENTIYVDADAPDAGVLTSFDYTVDESSAYVNGDANRDETINLEDAVFLIEYVFRGGAAPNPEPAGDTNCDGVLNLEDAVYLINYIFKGGPPPCYFPH